MTTKNNIKPHAVGRDRQQLLYVEIMVQGEPVKTLFDTGAGISVIGLEVVKRLGLGDKVQPTDYALQGAFKSKPLHPIGEVSILFHINKQHFPSCIHYPWMHYNYVSFVFGFYLFN